MTEDELKELRNLKKTESRALNLYARRARERDQSQHYLHIYTKEVEEHPRIARMTEDERQKRAENLAKEVARLQRLVDKHAATIDKARARIAELEAKIPQPTVSESRVADVLEAAIKETVAKDPEWGSMVRVPGNKLHLHAGGAVFVVTVSRGQVVPK